MALLSDRGCRRLGCFIFILVTLFDTDLDILSVSILKTKISVIDRSFQLAQRGGSLPVVIQIDLAVCQKLYECAGVIGPSAVLRAFDFDWQPVSPLGGL